MWILTESYDDYDQHGDYFVTGWCEKPTVEQIAESFADHEMKEKYPFDDFAEYPLTKKEKKQREQHRNQLIENYKRLATTLLTKGISGSGYYKMSLDEVAEGARI
jgi:hypothetical protein